MKGGRSWGGWGLSMRGGGAGGLVMGCQWLAGFVLSMKGGWVAND